MISSPVNYSFWQNKKVFLTGHTGFKGGWLALWLSKMGAKVTGYALAPNTTPNLFETARIAEVIEHSIIADIRDLERLKSEIKIAQPEIVIHMAAQPLVRYSYQNPVETYSTNVMGTVNVFESMRSLDCVRSALVVTSDKCYENQEWPWGYRENEPMGGHDPYSNSKGCAELVTAAFRESYFSANQFDRHRLAIASGRAGNVIGGGDWSTDRLIPDAIKAFEANQPLTIRNPLATRPWQHVLEPLSGYLVVLQHLYLEGPQFNGGWNFGPHDVDTRTVQEVVDLFINQWGANASWQHDAMEQPHEAHALKLDCSKAAQLLHWSPRWSIEQAIEKIVDWQKSFQSGHDMYQVCMNQIQSYQDTV